MRSLCAPSGIEAYALPACILTVLVLDRWSDNRISDSEPEFPWKGVAEQEFKFLEPDLRCTEQIESQSFFETTPKHSSQQMCIPSWGTHACVNHTFQDTSLSSNAFIDLPQAVNIQMWIQPTNIQGVFQATWLSSNRARNWKIMDLILAPWGLQAFLHIFWVCHSTPLKLVVDQTEAIPFWGQMGT